MVSGASGMVGRALRPVLAAAGHDVVALVRRAPGPGERRWDPAAGVLDAGDLREADAVVHLAGAGIGDRRWSPARRAEILDSRVRSTALLSTTLARLDEPPAVLAAASAVGWYGSRGDEVLDEDSAAGDGFLAEVCHAWEDACGAAADAGIRVAHLRSGIVLDASGGALARQLPLFRLGLGGRLGGGRQWLSWISLADEVAAIVAVLEDQALSGPVNLVAPQPVTNAEFTSTLARLLHRPAFTRVPRAALRLALGGDMADEVVLASQRVVPARLLAAGFTFAHPELGGALAAAMGRPG
ncbi:MAG TPA: TIGR01777 family oxidoreductase [Acidimicrobiales bacterium]|nr:TIGR01777 family oxidoreductase [Acidimicrobiales bacterium]